jgi:hypothetical protein
VPLTPSNSGFANSGAAILGNVEMGRERQVSGPGDAAAQPGKVGAAVPAGLWSRTRRISSGYYCMIMQSTRPCPSSGRSPAPGGRDDAFPPGSTAKAGTQLKVSATSGDLLWRASCAALAYGR